MINPTELGCVAGKWYASPKLMKSLKHGDTASHPCDLCGATDPWLLRSLLPYSGGQPIHVCTSCGLVYVVERRPQEMINHEWGAELYNFAYQPANAAVRARHLYVAAWAHEKLDWADKTVIDFGAGNGEFLDDTLCRSFGPDRNVFAVEPVKGCCNELAERELDYFHGTAQEYARAAQDRRFDIATVLWTLENSIEPRGFLAAVRSVLADTGHLVIATGSRILVPFKKPLWAYIGPDNRADTHATRYSAGTLRAMLQATGFEVVHENSYIDSDVLCMIARPRWTDLNVIPADNWRRVAGFFDRWALETERYWPKDERYYTGR